MALNAATATPLPHPWAVPLLALVVALLWVAGYAIACWIWPLAGCGKCAGTGKLRSPSGKAWRRCKRCKATGGRLRTGRRVFNFFNSTSRRASDS